MCVGRYAEKMQWSEAKWNLFEMPAIDMSILCIPAECDNIKLPIDGEIASRWDAYLLCDICRHFEKIPFRFAPLHLFCIPAYTHQIPNGISSHLLRDNMYVISFFSPFRQKSHVPLYHCIGFIMVLWKNHGVN